MNNTVRLIAFGVLAVALLLAIAYFAPRTMPGAVDAPKQLAEAKARTEKLAVQCVKNPYFTRSGVGSEWQRLDARGGAGEKYTFNPFTMTCDPKTGYRDIWLQVEYGQPQPEFEDGSTIISAYERERYLYRIDCVGQRAQVTKRQIMSSLTGDEVAHEMTLADGSDASFQPYLRGGVASVLAAPACSTGGL